MLREKASACVLGELGSRLLVLRLLVLRLQRGFPELRSSPPRGRTRSLKLNSESVHTPVFMKLHVQWSLFNSLGNLDNALLHFEFLLGRLFDKCMKMNLETFLFLLIILGSQ